MLEFCEKLTLMPSTMVEQDVQQLRAHGFSDRDILSVVLAAAYRNYIVRVADGLGVELNPTADYAAELIRAFGVDDRQARVTLYADRLTRTQSEATPAGGDREHPRARFAATPQAHPTWDASRPCWLDATPTVEHSAEFGRLKDELARASQPAPLEHLGQSFALRPDAFGLTVEYLRLVSFDGSGLGRRLEELIGLVVAATQWAPYPGVHHAERLLALGAAPGKVTDLVREPSGDGLAAREREVARFCEQLTRQPSAMTRADVDSLRAVGFGDRAIMTIVAGAALEDYLCRIAAGLGVQLERRPFSDMAVKAFQIATSY